MTNSVKSLSFVHLVAVDRQLKMIIGTLYPICPINKIVFF